MRLEPYLLNHPWLPVLLVYCFYTADHIVGIFSAKAALSQDIFEYEMSDEQRQSLEKGLFSSWGDIYFLCFIGASLLAVGYLTNPPQYLFGLFAGFALFPYFVRFLRRLLMIFRFKLAVSKQAGMTGHVKVSAGYTYKASANEMVSYAVILLVAFAFTNSPMLLGGVFGLMLVWLQYRLGARKISEMKSKESDAV